MNCMWEFILAIIMILGSVGDSGHVFRLNIKDNVSDGFVVLKSE